MNPLQKTENNETFSQTSEYNSLVTNTHFNVNSIPEVVQYFTSVVKFDRGASSLYTHVHVYIIIHILCDI